MRYNIMSYLIGEGFRNLLKNKKSTSAALTIMCLAMFMFGLFFVAGQNINYIMEQIESEQGMDVWLDKDVTDEQIKEIETQIRRMGGINTVEYVSKEEVINENKYMLGEHADETEGLEDYFQAEFMVTLTDLSQSSQIKKDLGNIDGVESVISGDEVIITLIDIAKGLRAATFGILIILILIATFIITNTIKLTVHARRKEISIMKYVGATNGFIRWPFIVEGIIIGLISAFVTILLVGLLYNFVTDMIIQSQAFQQMGLKLYTFADMFKLLLTTYILLGTGIGVLGSSISMRKYLDV